MINLPKDTRGLKISQPMDVIEKLRELVKPMGYEIGGFSWDGGRINLELNRPNDSPFTMMNPDQIPLSVFDD